MLTLLLFLVAVFVRLDTSLQQDSSNAVLQSKPMSISIEDLLDRQQGASERQEPTAGTSSGAALHHTGVLQATPRIAPVNNAAGIGLGSARDIESLSQDSMEVVNGLIEAFMNNAKLQPGEKTCIKDEIGTIAGDIMGTGQDVVQTVKTLRNGTKSNKTSQANPMGLIPIGVDAAMKIASLATMTTSLFRNCVHGDALDMFKTAAKHLINATYLGDRFIVNGIDILHCVSDCIVAFETHNYYKFGSDVGTSLRKILLSDATKADRTMLPEGYPKQKIIRSATEGLMRGFFVGGVSFTITDDAYSDVHLVVDLHRCISGNRMFWKEIWKSAWYLFAQFAVNGDQHGLGVQNSQMEHSGLGGKWSSELMMALMMLPAALQKCGMSPDTQSMLLEAIQSLGNVHVNFSFPEDRLKADKVTEEVAKAVEAWTDFDFVTFGRQLGMMLREFVMLAFPKKYYVDTSGHLQRDLLGLRSQGIFKETIRRHNSNYHSFIMLGFAASSLLALHNVRTSSREPTFDLEGAAE